MNIFLLVVQVEDTCSPMSEKTSEEKLEEYPQEQGDAEPSNCEFLPEETETEDVVAVAMELSDSIVEIPSITTSAADEEEKFCECRDIMGEEETFFWDTVDDISFLFEELPPQFVNAFESEEVDMELVVEAAEIPSKVDEVGHGDEKCSQKEDATEESKLVTFLFI